VLEHRVAIRPRLKDRKGQGAGRLEKAVVLLGTCLAEFLLLLERAFPAVARRRRGLGQAPFAVHQGILAGPAGAHDRGAAGSFPGGDAGILRPMGAQAAPQQVIAGRIVCYGALAVMHAWLRGEAAPP
jgi:hypothetical protein